MESYKVFSDTFHDLIKDGVNTIQLEKEDEIALEQELETKKLQNSSNQTVLSCSYCKITFLDSTQQREHYKLDWHRYNLKLNLLSKAPITEEEFLDRTDDVSSISGSDSEEEQSLDTLAGAQGKIFLKTSTGKVLGMYKCLLGNKKEDINNVSALHSLLEYHVNPQWALFMLGGGHFAGAIFKNEEPFLHKTFHCYTVRAGQGGTQSARDNQGSHPKSAGASLRRYNESALNQHVKDILENWKPEIDKSSLIICRAAGPYNKSILFGGKTPLLERNDPRIRNVPFSTRRATFTEVKRVFGLLSTISLFDSVDIATQILTSPGSPEKSKRNRSRTRNNNVNRAKSRETVERDLPAQISNVTVEENKVKNALVKSKKNSPNKIELISNESGEELEVEELIVNFGEELKTFDDSLTPEERKKKSNRIKQKAKKQKEKKFAVKRREEIFESCKNGDLDLLKRLLTEEIEENPIKKLDDFCTDSGDGLLHLAAKYLHEEIIIYLLENNCNLCSKNDKQETPYTCTKDKNVREFFKKYAAQNPDKFNYNKANIPTNTLTLEQIAEKKRVQRKSKKDKEKEKRKEQFIQKQEQDEKNRFLKLSDREKRALAAERRIINQSGIVITRCFLCASDMSGKVPFEYMGNRFCTIDCLKAHRMQHPVVLSTQ
nr:ankyrin repeat and zinc finger domain-containing protein 1-like [Onthophagus taurus]